VAAGKGAGIGSRQTQARVDGRSQSDYGASSLPDDSQGTERSAQNMSDEISMLHISEAMKPGTFDPGPSVLAPASLLVWILMGQQPPAPGLDKHRCGPTLQAMSDMRSGVAETTSATSPPSGQRGSPDDGQSM